MLVGIKSNTYLCNGLNLIKLCQRYFDFTVFRSFSIVESTNPSTYMWKVQRGFAKYNYDRNNFVLAISKGLKNNELKKIKFVIDENKDIIISRWKEYFEN